MLDIDGLGKRFGEVTALEDMTFSVDDGSLVGFIGPNGAGKTTTMRAILGLLKLDRGEVRWNGAPIDAGTRNRFGYMPEERGMYPRMRVLDEVVYFARLAGLSAADARRSARRWLDHLDLTDRYGDEVRGLSHGNQQRVQLAIALAHDPDLLVLDEPFSGLDPIAAETMRALLAERARDGAAVLFSSHQLDMVEDLCREVVIIDRGQVMASGSVDALRAAQPTRLLEVAFAPAAGPDQRADVARAAWASEIPGARRLVDDADPDADRDRLEVPADLDLGAALDRARRHGEVIQFSFEPPDLSVVFRNAVGRREQGDSDNDGAERAEPTSGDRRPSPDAAVVADARGPR